MGHIADEMNSLMHYGTKRHSGRYPWGSGKYPYQHNADLISRIDDLKKQGLSEADICKELGYRTLSDYKTAYRRANNERKLDEIQRIKSLRDDGLGPTEIGKIVGKSESTVRSMLEPNRELNLRIAANTADKLADELQTKKMLDVGKGVEIELGVTRDQLEDALDLMKAYGYEVIPYSIPQVTNEKQYTNTTILALNGINRAYIREHMNEVQEVGEYTSQDGGRTFVKLQYPASIDSKRIAIRYDEEGGSDKDGVIELRRGVADLDLGDSHYAQVRILVDGTHYLKGMAMYSDDLPDGADILFNTNKPIGTDKFKVLKEIKTENPDNPFGAAIKANGQSYYIGKDGKSHLSPINKLKEEGDWDTMSKNLSSQFLSKQPKSLISKQLNQTIDDTMKEYNEILSLTNPTLRKKLLYDFAEDCDSAAIKLKASAFPGQSTKVILPITSLKENECYAPTYENGTKVWLVRYPHAGTFEIPELTVNNKNAGAKSILGADIRDAIGINAKTASKLSGADFDGDQVIVIPQSRGVKISTKSSPELDKLRDFNPTKEYGPGTSKVPYTVMSEGHKQRQMGVVSNLITDMTLAGAPPQDIVKAVKHSMVVIDAVKHKLDYKRSEKENDIPMLRQKYQSKVDENGIKRAGGANTLISRRKQTVDVPERQGSGIIDKETGKITYKETGRTYVNKKGEMVKAKTQENIITNIDDVRKLSSGTPQENLYADYANKMKSLANEARKVYKNSKGIEYSPTNHKVYSEEVKSLENKLRKAELNAPRERRAQYLANYKINTMVNNTPGLEKDKKEIKKQSQIVLEESRNQVAASSKNVKITFTDKEWDAIQSGAISDTMLTKILKYADKDEVRQRATPRASNELSSVKIAKIQAMKNNGSTIAEIAKAVGCSTSTVQQYMNQKEDN